MQKPIKLDEVHNTSVVGFYQIKNSIPSFRLLNPKVGYCEIVISTDSQKRVTINPKDTLEITKSDRSSNALDFQLKSKLSQQMYTGFIKCLGPDQFNKGFVPFPAIPALMKATFAKRLKITKLVPENRLNIDYRVPQPSVAPQPALM